MPTYQYFCEKCKGEFEYFQSMKDKPLAHCPQTECHQKKWGKGRVKRLLSGGAGFIFKGSGFYITDYRSENYKSGAKKESDALKPASTSDTKTGDTKIKKKEGGSKKD